MKLKRIAILALALLAGHTASAEVSFGVKGGVSANWIPKTVLVGLETSVNANFGFYGGALMDVDISDLFLARAEVLYTRKGHSDSTIYPQYTNRYNLNISYLQLPLLFGIKAYGDKFIVMVGPEFAWRIGAQAVDRINGAVTREDAKEYCRPFNFGIAVQPCYMFTPQFGVEVKFDFGITKTFFPMKLGERTITDDKGHNTSVQIGVCYKFN